MPMPRSEVPEADRYRERVAKDIKRLNDQSKAGRDIGPIPKVAKPRRRSGCKRDLRRFCLTYFALTFPLAFSPDHLKVIAKIEKAVLEGGLFALAMPRGNGKTTLCEVAALWALVYGHRSFVVLIGAELGGATRSLETLKLELETNEELQEDFPEVCYPIQKLERIAHRCKGQTCQGEPTYIGWKADAIVLPTVPKSAASGATVKAVGLTGAIRGLKHKRRSGGSIRPDLAVIDDPQTDDSARSASQCAQRESLLGGAVLGLAGPGKKISGIMPTTVIVPGDMADRILDPKIHPDWNGERTKMLYGEAANPRLWDQYDQFRQDQKTAEMNAFYLAHQTAMDAGMTAAWPERKNPDEISAIQHAMNLKLRDPRAFAAEYQNEPLPLIDEDRGALMPEQIASRFNRHERGVAPAGSARLTAFIDVQQDLLYWCVCAWADDFTGSVVDYGAFPEQTRGYFSLRDANPTMAAAVGVSSLEGSIFAGLGRVADRLLGRAWPMDGGGELRVERCLADANWGQSTDTVYRWCRQSPHAAQLVPSHGKAIGASGNPMEEWQRKPGERRGLNWVMPPPKAGRGIRHLLYDVNFWKSFVHARLSQPPGERGSLTLFGDSSHTHRLFADHLTAEYRVRTQGRGREVDEWQLRPDRPDNHWLDCVVGCAVAASLGGAALAQAGGGSTKPRGRVSWAEQQRRAKEARKR